MGENFTDLPRASVKLSSELICHGIVRSNRTLCDTWDAVHLIHARLKEAMPVHGRSFVVELVGDFHPDHISVVCFDERSWELSVDADSLLGLDTVGSNITLGDFKFIGSCSTRERARLVGIGAGSGDTTPWSLSTTTLILWQSLFPEKP